MAIVIRNHCFNLSDIDMYEIHTPVIVKTMSGEFQGRICGRAFCMPPKYDVIDESMVWHSNILDQNIIKLNKEQ